MELFEKSFELAKKEFHVEFYLIAKSGETIFYETKKMTYLELGTYLMTQKIDKVKIIERD